MIDLQKEIHSQKIEHYEQLRRFYWTVSFALLASYFGSMMIKDARFLLVYTLLVLFSFIITIIGGKLYYIDKINITKKAIAKSKFFDAMEIETINSRDINKKRIGFYLIATSGLFLLAAICIIIINN